MGRVWGDRDDDMIPMDPDKIHPEPDPQYPDPIRPTPIAKRQRDPGDWFALIATGVVFGGLLVIVAVLLAWVVFQLITALPW